MRDAANAFGFDDADGESPQPSDIFWAVTSAYAAAVFVIVPIDNVMATVFDTPVTTVGGKNAFRIGLLRGSTGDAICDFTRVFATFFIYGLPLDEKSLADMRKVQIAVEFCCGPDCAGFDPAVIRGVTMDKIGVLPIFKI